jgi:hypothetical protein
MTHAGISRRRTPTGGSAAERSEVGKRLGFVKMHARVRAGGWFDATEAAAASNARHGLKRSNADKRKAIELLLTMPKWADASDREIARHCMVSNHLVAEVRSPSDHNSQARAPQSGNSPTLDDRPHSPRPEPEPLDDEPYDLPLIGAPAERTRQREEMRDEPWPGPPARDPWPTMPLVKTINDIDLQAWLGGATDRRRRWLADIAFAAIESADERLRHDEKVQGWLAQHEQETGA